MAGRRPTATVGQARQAAGGGARRCARAVSDRCIAIGRCDELGEERQGVEGAALARSLAGEPVAISVHRGLSDTALGERQKKGETLVVDGDGRVVRRIRV
jgi:hypothetical protein